MAAIINVARLDAIPSFAPPITAKPGPQADPRRQRARHLAIWHGQVEPGGQADAHLHPTWSRSSSS